MSEGSEQTSAASLDGNSLLPRVIPSCSFGSFYLGLHTMIQVFLEPIPELGVDPG